MQSLLEGPLTKQLEQAKEYVARNKCLMPLRIGYGNRELWGESYHLVVFGHEAAGGPIFKAAARPIMSIVNRWYPLQPLDGYTYELRKNSIDLIALCASMVSGSAFQPGVLTLLSGERGYLDWLGFVLEVEKHPDGLIIEE